VNLHTVTSGGKLLRADSINIWIQLIQFGIIMGERGVFNTGLMGTHIEILVRVQQLQFGIPMGKNGMFNTWQMVGSFHALVRFDQGLV